MAMVVGKFEIISAAKINQKAAAKLSGAAFCIDHHLA